MPFPMEQQSYTYVDYLSWDEGDRMELIEGAPIMMAPPSTAHQAILMEMSRQLANYLDGKNCKVFPAPFAVRLFSDRDKRDEDVNTVVEPDITIVCDLEKLDKRGCNGAPDAVIEILSPSTAKHDRFTKLHLYRKAGVKEYWIVDPAEKSVQVCLFDVDAGPAAFYTRDDIAKVSVLQGCFIELEKVFPDSESN